MIKRILCVLVLAALVAGGAFAQFQMSAGFGMGVFPILGGGLDYTGKKTEFPMLAVDLYGFFDATLAEASIGLVLGLPPKSETFGISFSLIGKYPLRLNQSITFFPAVGIDYQSVFAGYVSGTGEKIGSSINSEEPENSENSALWFKFGAGLDYNINYDMYLRLTALYGVRLPNKFEQDRIDTSGATYVLGHGITIKLGLGFRF